METRGDIRVGTIAKNKLEELRITLREFKGHELVDIRVFAEPYADDGNGKQATKRGVSLSVGKLPALIDALQAAERRARDEGLLVDEQEAA